MSFTAIYMIAGELLKVLVPSLLAFFAWWQSKGNKKVIGEVKSKMTEAEKKAYEMVGDVVKLKDGVQELRITIDGRLSQLLKLTESSAFARGQLNPTAEEDIARFKEINEGKNCEQTP